MGRLFWKIFLWFWLTMILMTLGIAWGMAQFFQLERDTSARALTKFAQPQVIAVSAVLEHASESATRLLLQEITDNTRLQILVIDENNRDLLGRRITGLLSTEKRRGQLSNIDLPKSLTERTVTSPTGNRYRVVAWLPDIDRLLVPLKRSTGFGLLQPLHRDPWLISIRLSITVLLSGLVCFWLAW